MSTNLTAINNESLLTVPNNMNGSLEDIKSKERKEKDRKAIRLRNINSLKRQINIKEKMLEVSFDKSNISPLSNTSLTTLWTSILPKDTHRETPYKQNVSLSKLCFCDL